MWTVDKLKAWGKCAKLTTRTLANDGGVMFIKGGITLFSVYLTNLDDGFEAEIAFNKKRTDSTNAYAALSDMHRVATPKTSHQWSRIGVIRLTDAVLTDVQSEVLGHS